MQVRFRTTITIQRFQCSFILQFFSLTWFLIRLRWLPLLLVILAYIIRMLSSLDRKTCTVRPSISSFQRDATWPLFCAPDSSGKFSHLKLLGQVRLCARALTLAPYGNASPQELARLNPQKAELQSLLLQSNDQRLIGLVNAAIKNYNDSSLLGWPYISITYNKKYLGNREVMLNTHAPYPSTTAPSEFEVDE